MPSKRQLAPPKIPKIAFVLENFDNFKMLYNSFETCYPIGLKIIVLVLDLKNRTI